MNVLQPDNSHLLIEEANLPFYVYGDVYRIGTIADGSCMIHSILLALSEDYRKNNFDYRMTIAKYARKDLSEKMTPELWERLGKGTVALNGFLENFRNRFNSSADSIFSDIMCKKVETLSDFMNSFKKQIVNTDVIEKVANDSYNQSYKEFLHSIENTRVWIDSSMIELLQLYFNVNLIIIYDRTNVPYPMGKEHFSDERKYICVYWVNESHYELIGLRDGDNTVVVFEKNDPLIRYFLSKM